MLGLDKKKTTKSQGISRFRSWIQAGAALLTNVHLPNFLSGRIYQGDGKAVCVPGLNCYSCPGATGACPIGSLQAVIGSWNFKIAYYVVGFLIFVGALLGRLVCGFLCPFGLIQDLLNKIPFPKKIRTFRGDKLLRKLKYVIFIVFVILLPMFVVDIMGQGAPYFCKLICPAGTLEGGLPLVLLNKAMRGAIGWLYIWKNAILIATIVVWFLQSFDLHLNLVKDSADSILAMVAGVLAPIFKPIGLGDWRICTALISGFMAKESVVSTLEVLFGGGIASVLTPLSAGVLLVFSLLYTPCVAAVASVKRELGAKWAVGMVFWQCLIAWVVAIITRGIGMLLF